MRNPSISIIMPLYNAAKYLEESINSIRKQTFEDFELICMNDASTDDTLEILRHFRKNDARIKIFSNEERKGAAFSRNRGMKEAGGTYLSFLDGDDIFEEEISGIPSNRDSFGFLKNRYYLKVLYLEIFYYSKIHIILKHSLLIFIVII